MTIKVNNDNHVLETTGKYRHYDLNNEQINSSSLIRMQLTKQRKTRGPRDRRESKKYSGNPKKCIGKAEVIKGIDYS